MNGARYRGTVTLFGLGLLFAGLSLGVMFITSCSENLDPGTARKEVCDAVDHSGWTWTAAALWPAVLFAASQLVRPCRRHVVLTAIAIAVLGVAFWIPLLLIASSNVLAD